MQFSSPLIIGRFLRRYQRFFADVEVPDRGVVVAHCANTGSMKTCLEPGTLAWLSEARPGRKLAYTWEVAERDGVRIYVNPAGANGLVTEAIQGQRIPELRGYERLRREVKYGQASRVDFLLEGRAPELAGTESGTPHDSCYVEVKNVTMDGSGGRAAFPDAVTERGRRHIEELEGRTAEGHRAVLFFCIARTDAELFVPADAIDPAYGKALRRAYARGVEVLAYRVAITPEGVELTTSIPVDLS